MKDKFIITALIIYILLVLPTKTDASVPVTYTCCYNYTYDNGILEDNFGNITSSTAPFDGMQIDNFQNLSNWTVGGTLGYSQRADTVNFKVGQQGLMLIAKYGNVTNFNRTYSDKAINNNFSNLSNFGIWLYSYNPNTVYEATLYFTSAGSAWSKYFIYHIYTTLSPGWNKLIINQNNFISINGENWNNTMNRVRIAVVPTSGQDTNVTFGDFRYNVSAGNWIPGGNGVDQEIDSTNFIGNNQGLKLIANGNTVYTDKIIKENLSNINNFAVWAYVDNASNFYSMNLYITSNGNNWSTFFYDTIYGGVKSGWNRFIFSKHNFVNVGGENWNNVMNKIRLRIWPMGNNLNVTFDDLRYNLTGSRAKLIIEFDDGDLSAYTKAYPILSTNNQSGVSFVVTSWIGSIGMNLSNLHSLQAANWDISSHTADHLDLTTLDNMTLSAELNDSYRWLVANNFQKSAGFIAYPSGRFNDNVLDNVKKRYLLGRATIPQASQQYFTSDDDAIKYTQRIIYVYNSTTLQSIEDYINDTINSKLLGILLFHDIADTNPSNYIYTYSTSDFQKVSSYIKSRNADIDVITYSDYVIPNIANFTPVINKKTRIYSNGSSSLMTNNKYDEYLANATIIPSSDYVDINITEYDDTGGEVKFNDNEPNGNMQVSYSIGDRKPNWLYYVNVSSSNGMQKNFTLIANDTGYINYNLTGFQDTYQDIIPQAIDTSFIISLPAGYTSLRFNSSNSTVNNLNPDGQTTSQPFFIITNSGNINQSFAFYIDSVPTNITTYADLANDFSSKVQINTTNLTTVVPNLGPGKNQSIWMLIDANSAPPMNTYKNLGIGIMSTTPGFISNDCDQSLWSHVWGENQNLTYRLALNTTYRCIKVSATIDTMKMAEDGDYHITLHLDPQYSFLLNQLNYNSVGGDLITEPICSNGYSVNEASCNDFNQSYITNNLSIGAHIIITGAYVTDILDGGWNEIHPITSIGPVILDEVTNRTNYSNVGDVIQYTYIVKNVGDVGLTGLLITDNKTGNVPCTDNLYPGQTIQCLSKYTIDQDDINNGSVASSAYISIVSNGTIINSNRVSEIVSKS